MSIITRPNTETKLLRATPETVHWGYLDASHPAGTHHRFR